MNYYLVPTAATVVGSKTITAPKYLLTDLVGATFGSISYGVEGLMLLALSLPNAALSAEADVFTLGNVASILTSSDVSQLSTYLSTYKVPVSQLAVGQSWQSVIRQLAQIFLAAQYASGQNGGQSIFTGGKTLSSSAIALGTVPKGTFNFASHAVSNIGTALVAVAAQFTGAIKISNGGTL